MNARSGPMRAMLRKCTIAALAVICTLPFAHSAFAAFAAAASLTTARVENTSTLLSNGMVLAAGGGDGSSTVYASSELYDPAANIWNPGPSMSSARVDHTATRLLSGKVLVVGGSAFESGTHPALATAEIYDPATNSWTPAATLATARLGHTATLLPSGQVLVAGGVNGFGVGQVSLASAEIYDPASDTWSPAGTLPTAIAFHTATLLASGDVIVAGGGSTTIERYSAATSSWSSAGSLIIARTGQSATLLQTGKILLAGTGAYPGASSTSAELYDPTTGISVATGSMTTARYLHAANLLPSGQVLVTGGIPSGLVAGTSAETYDPVAGVWTPAGTLVSGRYSHTATLLANGSVLLIGGEAFLSPLSACEAFDPTQSSVGTAASLPTTDNAFAATVLTSGAPILFGGQNTSNVLLRNAFSYDPVADAWTDVGLPPAVEEWTATVLVNGQVLLAGGVRSGGFVPNGQVYDPVAKSFTATGSFVSTRIGHTSTLLANGKVLIAGGQSTNNLSSTLNSAEIYDPATNAFTAAASMSTARTEHTATLLPNGKVLVVGGTNSNLVALNSAEVYDPAANTWTTVAHLNAARLEHTATLLLSGKVLVVAGGDSVPDLGDLTSTEIYDPVADTWTNSGSVATPRALHSATLLPSGKVLIAGGVVTTFSGTTPVESFTASLEIYDPLTTAWTSAGSLAAPRFAHFAAVLPATNKVLFAGGRKDLTPTGVVATAELFDPGLVPNASLQPTVTAVSSVVLPTTTLGATGSGFAPDLGASGGSTNESPTNFPVFQIIRQDSGFTRFVANDETVNYSDGVFTASASALAGFPGGPFWVRAWVNGVPTALKPGEIAVTTEIPSAPIAVGGTLTATVNFTAARYDGGAPITNYIATANPGGATQSCTAPCTSIVFPSLPVNAYTFTVAVQNAVGIGTPSAPSNSVFVKTTTNIDLESSLNPSTYGQNVIFTATLTGHVPTGTLSFFDGSTPLCANVAMTGGTATCATATLFLAPHSMTAVYAGDNGNLASTSPVLTQLVAANSATTLFSSSNPSAFGQSVTFTVTVAGNSPSGTVDIDDGATQLCSVVLTNGGATCETSALAIGNHAISANYLGDDGNIPSISNTVMQEVGLAGTTTTLAGTPNPSIYGQMATFTATVAGQSPSGTVTFTDGATPLCAGVALTGTTAACATSALTGGIHFIVATYNGDAANAASGSATYTQFVNAYASSITLAIDANPVVYGNTFTLTATVSGQTPTGSVVFSNGQATLCTSPLVGSTAVCETSTLATGSYALSAEYMGDGNNSAALSFPVLETVSVTPTTTTLSSSCMSTFVGGQPYTFSAQVAPANPSGSVSLSAGGVVICANVPLVNGVAVCTTNALTTNDVDSLDIIQLSASYGGDANHAASNAQTLAVTVLSATEVVFRSDFEAESIACPID